MKWITRLKNLGRRHATHTMPRIFLTNTLSGNKEVFMPHKPGSVTLYSCGPTVYGRAHIGNLRSYIFSDTLARTLKAAGYRVRRVINITDVGHLVSDAEEGEDKMTLTAKNEKTSPENIANRYTALFIKNLAEIGIDTDDITFPRATSYIKEQIAFAKTLEEKGFAYRTKEGLYFDTARFPNYGKLGNLSGAQLKAGARVSINKEKRNVMDFALWRSAKPNDLQQWDSPWGKGNPGWHIECSAMSRALLGQKIDIHTGGEDHIQIHHNNEIAQSESVSGQPFVRYWMHNAFLTIGEKISKSLGNVVYLSEISEKGFHPLSLRYFFLQAHYRSPLSFSWDALEASASALNRLWRISSEIANESERKSEPSEARDRFLAAVRDDLATPIALSILWDSLRSEDYSPEEKWGLIEVADAHLGLSLSSPSVTPFVAKTAIPKEIAQLLAFREAARDEKNFTEADRLRHEIENSGYLVEDGPSGPVLTKATL